MTYEEKMAMLNSIKPEEKDALLLRMIRGEQVRITNNEDLFYQVNKDRMSLTDFTVRKTGKFNKAAEDTKFIKAGLHDKKHGLSKNKKLRYLGEIPAEIYFARPEFSPLLPKEERDRNIKKFLNEFPAFKGPEGKV